MATDGDHRQDANRDDMLPDERAVLAERADDLDTLDDDEFLTVDELAADLGIDLADE